MKDKHNQYKNRRALNLILRTKNVVDCNYSFTQNAKVSGNDV